MEGKIRISKGLKKTIKNACELPILQALLQIENSTDNYEVLVEVNRLYGDIDGKNIKGTEDQFNDLNTQTKDAIINFLKDEKYCLMTASSYESKKISWRFVVLDRSATLADNKRWVLESIEFINLPEGITFDTAPYGGNQKMRMLNSNKGNENRPLRLVKGEPIDTLISYIPKGCRFEELPKEKSKPISKTNDPINSVMLEKLVMNIANDSCYEQWIKLGMAIRSAGGSEDLFHKWSRQSDSYNERECSQKWDSFSDKSTLTAGSIFHWSKESDSIKHNEIVIENRKNTLWDLITLLNHNDVAKYFNSKYPDSYLWNETMGWFLLGENNVWFQSKTKVPCGLKKHVSDVMMEIVHEAKTIELKEYSTKSTFETDPVQQTALTSIHNSKIKILNNAYRTLGSDSFCTGIIAFLPTYYEVRDLANKMNMNQNLFAFTDKVYDLQAGKPRDINPKDYISITTGYSFPSKSRPEIREEISKLLYGLFERMTTKNYLLLVLASCFFGNNKFEEFYIFTGSGGNGKGVLNDFLRYVFGDYYISVDVSLFTKPVDKKDQPAPALVEAQYKRVMITTEPEKDDKLQVGLLKKISGNDIIEARTLHSNHIVRYVPQFKVIIQANSIPKLNKIDGGVSRRLRVIHFPFKFVQESMLGMNPNNRLGDTDVKDKKCRSVEWRDEFCLMLLEEYEKVKKMQTLEQPTEVLEATGEYMDDNDPVKRWLEAKYNITKNEKDAINSSELKQAFITDTLSERIGDLEFKSLMILNNIHWKKTKVCNVYCGLVRKIM